MKTFRKLHRKGLNKPVCAMYETVVDNILRILGTGSTDAKLYKDSDAYAEKYLAHNLIRKSLYFGDIKTKEEKQQASLEGFLLRETVNRKINETCTFGYESLDSPETVGLKILWRAKDIIHDIVGSLKISDYALLGQFGNGASATLKRASATPGHKYLVGRSVTPSLYNLAASYIATDPNWARLIVSDTIYVDQFGQPSLPPDYLKRYSGAVADFVPKDKSVDRMIFKEPELNGLFQKGLGDLLRKKLATWTSVVPDGIHLSSSGDLNSDLARQGSLYGHISTIDAERASDSLTIALYEFLFPDSWVAEFKRCRSPYTLINGKFHRNELMSGMGNGFTFEAESIIFYAVGLAAAEGSNLPFAEQYVSIHGDDLTVPSDVYDDVSLAYQAMGVVVNHEKSFKDGPFRESCGGHFFNGLSVKPFYLKKQNGSNRGDWFWLANSLLLWIRDRSESWRTSHRGVDLVSVLRYVRWYASSGSPNQWRIPFHYSRRAGLYSKPYVAKGKSWKSRLVRNRPLKQPKAAQDGLYLAWLRTPQVSLTVLELLYHRSNTAESDFFTYEVVEFDGQSRIWDWPDEPTPPEPLCPDVGEVKED